MTGEKLYGMYEEANLERDCGVDSWESLTDDDKEMWNRFAEMVDEET